MQPIEFTTAIAEIRRDEQIDAVRIRRRFPRLRRVRSPRPRRAERRVGGAR